MIIGNTFEEIYKNNLLTLNLFFFHFSFCLLFLMFFFWSFFGAKPNIPHFFYIFLQFFREPNIALKIITLKQEIK